MSQERACPVIMGEYAFLPLPLFAMLGWGERATTVTSLPPALLIDLSGLSIRGERGLSSRRNDILSFSLQPFFSPESRLR